MHGKGEIMHLGIRRPWRRRGLGMALLQHSLQTFYRHGIGTIRLNVDVQSLTNAQQLYQRAGFACVDSFRNYHKSL
ncbi:GNAT family N-acetyltransferase [Ktedonosporobacter rubrisoli]|uniref:GNAT family N-acetyltransferase n=1 Tax=Ktedonosporobacter rubrisoli TaxID=2509675 RepID=UPI001F5D426F|nr:GNAT family N-acetyltransferase [Ktedonosporobacter rubrisoli]